MLSARGIQIGSKTCYCIYGFAFRNCEYKFDSPREIDVFYMMLCVLCCIGFFVKYFKRELWFNKKRLLWFNDLKIE